MGNLQEEAKQRLDATCARNSLAMELEWGTLFGKCAQKEAKRGS